MAGTSAQHRLRAVADHPVDQEGVEPPGLERAGPFLSQADRVRRRFGR